MTCVTRMILGGILSLSTAISAHAWELESGFAATEDGFSSPVFKTINFQQSFDTAPVVVVTPTNEGGDPSELRIKNVTTTSFDVAAVEAPGEDGPHVVMNFHYMAMEAGVSLLPDGTQIAAGFHSTSTQQASGVVGVPTGWDIVNFGTSLGSFASVVASIQTMASEENIVPGTFSQPFLSVAMLAPGTSSVQMALERSEASPGIVDPEVIGWIAFPNGFSGQFSDTGGSSIFWDSRNSGDDVQGWDNGSGCTFHQFSGPSWANPVVIATKNSRDGGDGGWVRRCGLTGNTVGLNIDEDQFNDNERSHTSENVGMVSFSDSFHAVFDGLIDADKTAALSAGNYALPGSEVRYTISAQSIGNTAVDADSVVITDAIPGDVSLKVADIATPGSGPVEFLDGSPNSNLTYSFTSLSNLTDDVSFSNDNGSSFTYIPIADGTGGDLNVTHIRINPKGAFVASTGLGTPEFEVSFDVIIK